MLCRPKGGRRIRSAWTRTSSPPCQSCRSPSRRPMDKDWPRSATERTAGLSSSRTMEEWAVDAGELGRKARVRGVDRHRRERRVSGVESGEERRRREDGPAGADGQETEARRSRDGGKTVKGRRQDGQRTAGRKTKGGDEGQKDGIRRRGVQRRRVGRRGSGVGGRASWAVGRGSGSLWGRQRGSLDLVGTRSGTPRVSSAGRGLVVQP